MTTARRFPADQYTTLMASLPLLGKLTLKSQTPLSRLRLDARLGMLEPAHASLLAEIERVIQWSHQLPEQDDAAAIARAETLLAGLWGPLHALVQERLEMRTLVAALRHRQRSPDRPPARPWGLGRWTGHLERHWAQPDFQLGGLFPWLPEVREALSAGHPVTVERLLLTTAWKQLSRAATGHYFDFVAVVIYVLQWNIVERWAARDEDGARHRFAVLLQRALGPQQRLFPATVARRRQATP